MPALFITQKALNTGNKKDLKSWHWLKIYCFWTFQLRVLLFPTVSSRKVQNNIFLVSVNFLIIFVKRLATHWISLNTVLSKTLAVG